MVLLLLSTEDSKYHTTTDFIFFYTICMLSTEDINYHTTDYIFVLHNLHAIYCRQHVPYIFDIICYLLKIASTIQQILYFLHNLHAIYCTEDSKYHTFFDIICYLLKIASTTQQILIFLHNTEDIKVLQDRQCYMCCYNLLSLDTP